MLRHGRLESYLVRQLYVAPLDIRERINALYQQHGVCYAECRGIRERGPPFLNKLFLHGNRYRRLRRGIVFVYSHGQSACKLHGTVGYRSEPWRVSHGVPSGNRALWTELRIAIAHVHQRNALR